MAIGGEQKKQIKIIAVLVIVLLIASADAINNFFPPDTPRNPNTPKTAPVAGGDTNVAVNDFKKLAKVNPLNGLGSKTDSKNNAQVLTQIGAKPGEFWEKQARNARLLDWGRNIFKPYKIQVKVEKAKGPAKRSKDFWGPELGPCPKVQGIYNLGSYFKAKVLNNIIKAGAAVKGIPVHIVKITAKEVKFRHSTGATCIGKK